ncbi:hypothetical protein Tco_1524920 [Tanacetum coccineum]
MAHQQHAPDVHPDKLCPPNKRYDLMDANKKIDFEQVQCPSESKLLTNIIKNHPLRFSIAASSSVPWIYMAQFWNTLNEDGSKYRLTFMLDKQELSLTLDDFRTIFHLPQATDNNHDNSVPPPSFLDMIPFYKNELGFTMVLNTSSSFKTTGLLQPWQTLCKIFSKCLTTRVTGWDQPSLQTIRAQDIYHNLQDDDIMKNIFNSGRNKNKVRMRIPAWMITEEMKQTEHYQMYVEVFGLDVPLTQSQLTESTQGMHRTTSAPRSPNPITEATELSAPKRSIVIRFRLPERRSTRLTPPASVPTTNKADEMLLQDTLQVSLAEHKSHEEQEADDSSPPRNDDTTILGTRLEPRSDKESLELEITKEKEVEITKETKVEFVAKTVELTSDKASLKVDITKENEEDITNIVPPVNVDDEEDEITDEVYELKRRFMPRKSSDQLADDLHDVMAETLPSMVKDHVTEQVKKQVRSNFAKRQKTSEYEAYVSGESSSGQVNEEEPDTKKQVSLRNYGRNSLTIDEAKLKKMADEMLRQRCTSGDEHQYHIDQMKNFLQSSRKEILVSPHPRKATPLILSCQRNHDALTLSLINQDLLYLKEGNSGPEMIVLSLHKFLAVIFNDDDIEEQTSRWKEPGSPKEEIYSNSKIVQVIKTYWELGHENKFITEIVERRANDCIVSITEPDYKNLNKNDIKDIYLLIMNGKVSDYVDTGLLWSLSVFIRSSVIWERVHDFQLAIESY